VAYLLTRLGGCGCPPVKVKRFKTNDCQKGYVQWEGEQMGVHQGLQELALPPVSVRASAESQGMEGAKLWSARRAEDQRSRQCRLNANGEYMRRTQSGGTDGQERRQMLIGCSKRRIKQQWNKGWLFLEKNGPTPAPLDKARAKLTSCAGFEGDTERIEP
jgi:hypothetical protein